MIHRLGKERSRLRKVRSHLEKKQGKHINPTMDIVTRNRIIESDMLHETLLAALKCEKGTTKETADIYAGAFTNW